MDLKVSPSAVSEILAPAIDNNLNVLLVGPPGIGKTDMVVAAANEIGADLIESHPAVEDPSVYMGLPWPDKDNATANFLPFGNFAKALKATKKTVWFFDDLGQAPPAVQAAAMQLLLAKKVNGHCLPDCVTFVAATNRRQDKAGVQGILEPVKSRFVTILQVEPQLDDWVKWAYQHNIDKRLIAFMRLRGVQLLLDFKPSLDMENSPNPRSWANADKILKTIPRKYWLPCVAGAVGHPAASELISFLDTIQDMPNPTFVLANPDKAKIPTNLNAEYALISALAGMATKENFGSLVTFGTRLLEAGHAELASLMLNDAERCSPEVVNSVAYVNMATGPLGELLK